MKEKSIFDTGFLYAYLDEADAHYKACFEVFYREATNALLPDIVLPELAYLILHGLNVKILSDFCEAWREAILKLSALPKRIWDAPPRFWRNTMTTILIWLMR